MKLIKKVWEAEISTKLVAICVCLALIALLIPIARIMGDCVPWYDDFSYGKTAKIYWEMNHSFLDVLKGVIQSVKGIYYSWQGTYTTCFFMSMMPAMEAILRSFRIAFSYLWDFTGWMTLAIVLFTIPVAWCLVTKTNFTFRYPGLVILWSFCLYAAGFSPMMYTTGNSLLGRANNMVKVTFQLLLFIDLIYLIGWICVTMNRKNRLLPIRQTLRYYLMMAVLMLCIFGAEPNKGGKYSSYCAYYFVHTGEAYNYYHEYIQRVALCEGPGEDIVVPPYVYKPWLLCLGDLSEDPEYEPNRFMAEYFGKNSIVCKPTVAGESE